MDELRILLFAANPSQDLRLDEEIQSIQDGLRESSYRERVRLVSALAARPKDLISRLSEHRPNVVHFSGHGLGGAADHRDGTRNLSIAADDQEAQIVLVDEATGGPKPVGQQALVNLFRTRRNKIQLVVLNACWTASQAKAISAVVDCVVGTNRAMGDEAARVFSTRFYHSLADGGSVRQAFDDAKVELEVHGIPESATPVLNSRSGVDPEQVVLLGPENLDSRLRALVRWAGQQNRVYSIAAAFVVLAGVVAFWPRDPRRPADQAPALTAPPPKDRLPAEAVSRLNARLTEVRRSIGRVFALGSYNYLMLQTGQVEKRIRDGSEPESDLAQAIDALSTRTDMMVRLQELERHAVDLGDSDGADRLLNLVKRAREELINDNVEAADALSTQIERQLPREGELKRPAHAADDRRPRVLEPGEDARKAIPWLWDNRAVLRVAFLDGPPERRKKILEAASEWTKYANLTFKVVDDPGQSDIRIATEPPRAAQESFVSYLGTMAREIPKDQPTAMLGFTQEMTEAHMTHMTLLVFGHVIGLISEHQNPNCRGIVHFKDEKEVLEFFAKEYSWDARTSRNFLYSGGWPQLSAYRACDPYSIMMHQLPPQVVENPAPEFLDLSDGDKAFARRLYP
jgi:hypothetical protein